MREFAQPRHRRAARMLGYTLLSDSTEAWRGLAVVLQARLTLAERGKLAYSVLRSLEPEAREMAFQAAHWGVVTEPGAPPSAMEEARAWATGADTPALKAFALAAYEAMSQTDQVRFTGYLMRGAA